MTYELKSWEVLHAVKDPEIQDSQKMLFFIFIFYTPFKLLFLEL